MKTTQRERRRAKANRYSHCYTSADLVRYLLWRRGLQRGRMVREYWAKFKDKTNHAADSMVYAMQAAIKCAEQENAAQMGLKP